MQRQPYKWLVWALVLVLITGSFPALQKASASSETTGSLTSITSPDFRLDSNNTVTATVYSVTDSTINEQYINGDFNNWNENSFVPMTQEISPDADHHLFSYTFSNEQLNSTGGQIQYKFMPGASWENSYIDPLNHTPLVGGNSAVSAMVLQSDADTAKPGDQVQINAIRTLADGSEVNLNENAEWTANLTDADIAVNNGLVTIPSDAAIGSTLQVSASFEGLEISKNITVLSSTLASPIINGDGTVTFKNVSYSGDTLYLVGDMNGWSENTAIEMTKQDGVFSVTLPLDAGTYGYKFIPNKGSWTGAFTDPLNSKSSNGNSVVYVPGISITSGSDIGKGSSMELTAQLISGEDGSASTIQPAWSLDGSANGVTLTGSTLQVSESSTLASGSTVTVIAANGNYTARKSITIQDKMYTFNLHYYRADQNYTNWDNWIWYGQAAGKAYPFTSEDQDGFVTVSVKMPAASISVIQRPGSWDSQDLTHAVTVSTGTSVDAWIIQDDTTVYYSRDEALAAITEAPAQRYIEFKYFRPNQDYDGWSLWLWNTGSKDGEQQFEEVKDGYAIARIKIGRNATSVGFKVKYGNWEATDVDFDRYIDTPLKQTVTKVTAVQGQKELQIVPSVTGPVMNDGKITFYYRDNELYNNDQMDQITSAKVSVTLDGQSTEYPMVYDDTNEYFSYTLSGLQKGHYTYSFLITKNGETTEVTDPENTENGVSSFDYDNPQVQITGSLSPAAIMPNENTVLTVQTASEEQNLQYRELYVDLTPVGGPAKETIDLALMQATLAVTDSTTAGDKTLTITAVDQYGNKHTGTVKLTVKTRQSAGSLDFDWDEARIYFLLTDRFNDGDTSNDYNVDKSAVDAYHGGDFKGLTEKLDYIKELGINTIWITPIVDNIDFNVSTTGDSYGYHGYWAKNFEALDEHLGNMDDFKTLINTAHDKGIKIMVDVVLNHTGYGLKETDTNTEVSQEDKDRFAGMLRTDGVSTDTDVVKGELAGLPDFITEDPDVRQKVIDWQAGWLKSAKTDRGDSIDYFRVDTVKHVDDTTWKAFKNALTTIDPDFKMIGEYYGASVDSTGGKLRSGEMDSLLDFQFKNTANDFINGNIDAVESYLEDRNDQMDNTATMGQFLSSHDEDGFLATAAGGDESLQMIAAALQITVKGQPVIYYGEELGQSGTAAGNLNRYDMGWDRLTGEQLLHDHYEKLLNIRAAYSKVFAKGTHTKVAGSDSDGYLVFKRSYNGSSVYVGLNTTAAEKTAVLSVPYAAGSTIKDLYNNVVYTVDANKQISVQLPSREQGGTAILTVNTAASSGNNGNSGSGSSGSSSAATTTTDSAGDQVLNVSGDQLNQLAAEANADSAVLDLDTAANSGLGKVLLPVNAADLLSGKSLTLKANGFTLLLPAGLLTAAQNQVPQEQRDGAQLSFTYTPGDSSRINSLLDQASGSSAADLKLAGGAYEFALSVVLKDGTQLNLPKFNPPVSLTLAVNADADKNLAGIYYLADNGSVEYVQGTVSGNTITGEVRHFSTYAVVEYDKSFTDVASGFWAYNDIRSLAAKQIVLGDNNQFHPSASITRAEFTAMLVRALNQDVQVTNASPFTDVKAGSWYADSIAQAYTMKLVTGQSGNLFNPNGQITREEMAVMTARALTLSGKAAASQSETDLTSSYADNAQISSWAKDAFNTALQAGILNGSSEGKLAPKAMLTRAEAAAVLARLLK